MGIVKLTSQDRKSLEAYLLGVEERDEAVFFLDPLYKKGVDGEEADFFGELDQKDTLVGAMVITGQRCNVLWQSREYLAECATILRRVGGYVSVEGPKDLAVPFLTNFTEREIASPVQEGTTCGLESQLLSATLADILKRVQPNTPRRALLNDVDRIIAMETYIDQDESVSTYSRLPDRKDTIQYLIDNYTTYIVEVDDEVVSVAYTDKEVPHGAHIVQVSTHPNHRGLGFARACTAAICAELFDRMEPLQRIFLTYADGNDPARYAYEKIGFTPIRKRVRARLKF